MNIFVKTVVRYIYNRAMEASTWKGLITAGMGVIGVSLTGDQSNQLTLVIISIVGLLGTFLPDLFGEKKIKNENLPPIDLVATASTNNELQYISEERNSNKSMELQSERFNKNEGNDVNGSESNSNFFNDK